jgi:diphthamide synthase subunit DPH2
MTGAGGVCFRRNLTAISRLEYETKSVSVSEDIQVLQIDLHRGSLSSINRESWTYAYRRQRFLKMHVMAATTNSVITAIPLKRRLSKSL